MYDSPSRTISWAGTIPAQSDILITYRVTLPGQTCRVDSYAGGHTGVCMNDLNIGHSLLLVPEPRNDAHLLHLSPFSGIRDAFPPRWLFCLPPEIPFGMGRGPNWNVFVAGVPNYWFNPKTLDFFILDDGSGGVSFAETVLGIPSFPLLRDVAVDPRDGTALFAGNNQVTTPLLGAIGHYDPATGQATPLVARADLYGMQRVVVGADGVIAAIVGSQDGVVQIDPDNPTNPQILSDPGVPFPTCIALDANGDYIVANWGPPKVLARVDRQTGVYTVLVPDLDTLFPISGSYTSAAVGDGGEIYLMSESSGGIVVQLGNPPIVFPLFLGETADLESVSGSIPCPGTDRDADGDVDLDDYLVFEACVQGPGIGVGSGCECLDFDGNGDVDLGDFAVLQRDFTG